MPSDLSPYHEKAVKWVFDQLIRQGYQPDLFIHDAVNGCDIGISGLCIKVKVALPTYRTRYVANKRRPESPTKLQYPRWQWFINPSYRDMADDWALVLIAQHEGIFYPYVLPGREVIERTHCQITSHPDRYKGWLSAWRDEWGVLDYLIYKRARGNGPDYQTWTAEIGGP